MYPLLTRIVILGGVGGLLICLHIWELSKARSHKIPQLEQITLERPLDSAEQQDMCL